MRSLYKFLLDYLHEFSGLEFWAKPMAALTCIILIALVAWFAHFITRQLLKRVIWRLVQRTKTTWDDMLVKNKVFVGLAHLVPAFIILYTADFAFPAIHQSLKELSPEVLDQLRVDYYLGMKGFLEDIAKIYFTVIIVFVANAVLNTAIDIYNTTSFAHHRPIKGYVQLVKILVYFMAGIMILSVLLGKNPTVLLTGLGAMAAVLLLIFKDTILGFVASIQLSANNMVKIGDWIEMRSHNADGTVTDITLNTVKVQNWDKTISTIPTYALVAESFNNWKGMEESDGRRIKRSVSIDTNTIRFCDGEMLERFEKFDLIRDYVLEKERELKEYNKGKNLSEEDYISGRHQTNVGIFRRYLEVYLQQHPMVNLDMTFLVRQLQPVGKGLPIEIYIFSKEQAWAAYESIQADIFDHILAVVPEFELKVFQEPSGGDFAKIAKNS